jgi:hypothetical protein
MITQSPEYKIWHKIWYKIGSDIIRKVAAKPPENRREIAGKPPKNSRKTDGDDPIYP